MTDARHALVLAKRNMIKILRTPEQLIDVTLQPVIFLLLFTYVFGGTLAGGSRHAYLQFLLPGVRVDLGVRRDEGTHGRHRAGSDVSDGAAVVVREQRVRAGHDHARLAAGVREREPALPLPARGYCRRPARVPDLWCGGPLCPGI